MILIVFLEMNAKAATRIENDGNLHQKVARCCPHHRHLHRTDCDVITVVCVRN